MPRPDRHREPLLSAAATQLRRKGYAAVSTAELLAEAGATNGSLYHHFPGGKEELARTALAASAARVEHGLRLALERAPDVETALRGWVGALVVGLEADPRDGCPVAPVAVEAASLGPELREVIAAAFAAWTHALADALEAQLPPEAALARARVLLSLVEGALLLDRAAGGTEHLRALPAAFAALLPPT